MLDTGARKVKGSKREREGEKVLGGLETGARKVE
jgi:hypothetical protein